MLQTDRIWLAQGENPCFLRLDQANRHGLVAGASGTGKTVTMKVMAEGFSKAGVPVFLADAKGDVAGMCDPGADTEKMQQRIAKFGIEDWSFEGSPCRIWNMLGGEGVPVRITISDMGPTLLSRLLGLSDVQAGVMDVVFHVADDNQLLLIDLKDLRSMLNYCAEHAKEIETTYGKVSGQSVAAILRELLSVQDEGGDIFFGEPNIDLQDWFAVDDRGYGYVNILDATQLIQHPQVYAMFLLWMMSHLFDTLPEVGDCDKPKFVFFFDEAHLLFADMPASLRAKIVQVVKLIRSKGVGIYFVTQSPSDIPDEVLAQLSNRVQHGLRAYTPAEQKAVKVAAQGFRPNPAFDSVAALQDLGTGEALVSFLDEDGRPSIVEQAKVLPPQCSMSAPSADGLQVVKYGQWELMDKYGTAVDRESAYELLNEQAIAAQAAKEQEIAAAQAAKAQAAAEAQAAKERAAAEKEWARQQAAAQKEYERQQREQQKEYERWQREQQKEYERQQREAQRAHDRMVRDTNRMVGNVANQIGREVSKQLFRGIFNGLR